MTKKAEGTDEETDEETDIEEHQIKSNNRTVPSSDEKRTDKGSKANSNLWHDTTGLKQILEDKRNDRTVRKQGKELTETL